MAVKLEKMSRDELAQLQADIEGELKRRAKEDRKLALSEARKAAEQFGFSLEELTGGASGGAKSKSKGVAKYRNPEDPSKTWTGRGRRPEWVKALDSAGRLDEALIG